MTNRGGRDLVVPLSETIEVSNTMEFSHTSGASVTVGTTFEAELPVPGLKVGASLDVSTSLQFSSGNKRNLMNAYIIFKTHKIRLCFSYILI